MAFIPDCKSGTWQRLAGVGWPALSYDVRVPAPIPAVGRPGASRQPGELWSCCVALVILAPLRGADTRTDTLSLLESPPPMPVETLEFLLLLSGWVVAFLLGRELQTGFRLWRMRTAEERARRETDA